MNFLENLKPLGLLLLRCALGLIFISHGYPKLFSDAARWQQTFPHMGFPPYFAYISGSLEFFGGCLLILGLLTRIAALLLAGELAVALVKVHWPHGGIYAVKNYELPLALCVGAFALATVGAGLISLDHPIFGSRAKPKPKN